MMSAGQVGVTGHRRMSPQGRGHRVLVLVVLARVALVVGCDRGGPGGERRAVERAVVHRRRDGSLAVVTPAAAALRGRRLAATPVRHEVPVVVLVVRATPTLLSLLLHRPGGAIVASVGSSTMLVARRVHLLDQPLLATDPCRLLRRDGRTLDKVGVVRVDVRRLDRDQRLDILRSRAEALAQQLRDNFDQLGVQARIPLQFLVAARVRRAGEGTGQPRSRLVCRERGRGLTDEVQLWQIFMSSS